MSDLRFALRQLAKAPGFTAAAVLTLALGIGANTAMFSVVDAVLIRALPFDDAGQLVHVWEASGPGGRNHVSVGVFSDWARHASAFDGLAAVANWGANVAGEGDPERIGGVRLSPNGLQLLRARPVVGRLFAPDEDQPGKNRVVVLTHKLWQRRFGGDPGVVGRALRMNGESYTVIGVLPPRFLPWDQPEFVVPFVFPSADLESRGSHWLQVIARLKPGVSSERGRQDLEAASRPYRALYPAWKKDWGVTVVPMQEQLTGDVRPMLLVLLGAVALVLLIACANVANLLLARAASRQREIAVRLAIGASRGRVVRQLLAESVLLALFGASGGLLIAYTATAAIRQASAANLPRVQEIAVDGRVLGFAVLMSLLTSLVFGLAPALQASRPDLGATLKDAVRGSSGARSRTRSALIVAEMALALVLLAGAGLLINSFARLMNVRPGFEPRQALALQISLPDKKYPDAESRAAGTERLIESLQALPGVEAVGATLIPPLGNPFDTLIKINGKLGPADGAFSCDFNYVAPGLFRALGIPLTRGRLFDDKDAAAKARVALVNETFVRTHFPTQVPLGQQVEEGGRQWQIVGVVGDIRQRGLARDIRPVLYRPLAFNNMANRTLVVRSSGAASAQIEPIRKAVLAVDPELPISNARSVEEIVSGSVAQRRLVLQVLALFAGGAVLLAAVGLYGVIAYTVSQRTREIGIRIAVGAARADVFRLFVRQAFRLAALGIGVGLLAGLAVTRVLASQLYDVAPGDPATFAAVSVLLLVVALLASVLPARRAAAVDPMNAMR